MLVAKSESGGRVTSQDLTTNEYRSTQFSCPYCNDEVVWVKRSKNGRVAHFRHLEAAGHESVSESAKHEALKLKLYEHYESQNDIIAASLEQRVGEQCADVYVVTEDREQVAIEVQLSYQGASAFERRTQHYENHNVATLWLLGERGFMDEKTISGTEGYSYKEPIKWLQKQYFGRAYFIHKPNGEFEIRPFRFQGATKTRAPGLYSCPFCTFRSYSKSTCVYCGEKMESVPKSRYKSLATITSGDRVSDYALLVPKRNGEMPYREYKIARFYDSKWWN